MRKRQSCLSTPVLLQDGDIVLRQWRASQRKEGKEEEGEQDGRRWRSNDVWFGAVEVGEEVVEEDVDGVC